MTVNRSYSIELKEKIIKSLQPPENKTVPQVVKEENIPTLQFIHGLLRLEKKDK